jgi:hypothetical protein
MNLNQMRATQKSTAAPRLKNYISSAPTLNIFTRH